MFGLGGYRLGSLGAGLCAIVLVLLRIYMVQLYFHRGTVRKDETPPVSNPIVPASSWLVFTTTDPDTSVRTEHARLMAYPELPVAAGASVPKIPPAPNTLELRATQQAEKRVLATLGAPDQTSCLAIDHVAAAFDSSAPQNFVAKPDWIDSKCTVEIAPFNPFLQNLLNAQTLVLTPHTPAAALAPASWTVSGLTWSP